MERCAAVHNKFSIFTFALSPRCDNSLLSCPAGRSEDVFTCLCRSHALLRKNQCSLQYKLQNFRDARTTEHSDFDYFVHLVEQFPRLVHFLRSLTKRYATRASRNFLTIYFPCFVKKKDFTGVADTPCRRSPFALNVRDVTFSSAWVWSNVSATTTELFRFFGSPSAFSAC